MSSIKEKVRDFGRSRSTLFVAATAGLAGGALIILGMRGRRPWRFVYTAAGLELIRRGISGATPLYRWGGPGKGDWRNQDDKIDQMSQQSFPASDAPAY